MLRFSVNPAKRVLRLASLGLLVTSCGQTTSDNDRIAKRAKFDDLLGEGRRIAYGVFKWTDDHADLSLTGGASAVVDTERDEASNVIGRITFDTSLMEKVAKDDLDRYVAETLAAEQATLGVAPSDLAASASPRVAVSPRVTVVSFDRQFAGHPVRDAFVELSFTIDQDGDYRLREIINRSYGALELPAEPASRANFAELADALGLEPDALMAQRRLVWPERGGDGLYQFLWAREFVISDAENDEVYVVTVAEEGGRILESYRNRVSSHSLRGKVYRHSYLDAATVDHELPLMTVEQNAVKQTTDADGVLATAMAGAPATLTLAGPRARVLRQGEAAPFSFAATLAAGDGTVITPNQDQSRALNTFTSVQRINRFVRRHYKSDEVSYLDQATQVTFDVTGSCNAFYDPTASSISIFAEGQGCANLAWVNDVIYHEWGHGLDNFTGRNRGITDGAFSEGIGDIISSYYSDDSTLAKGFILNNQNGIRELANQKRYPDDQGEVHDEGQIIGGAFWDLRKALIDRYGSTKGAYQAEQLFFRHLLTTDSYRDSYQSVLRLDDEDGNPATPSPNHCLINTAFAAHGLATAENCSDEVPKPAVPVDDKLVLAVQSESEAGARLMIAAGSHDAVKLCLGDRESCLGGGGEMVAFKLEGATADGRRIFQGMTAVALTEQSFVTILALDDQSDVVAARELKISTK